MSTFTPYTYIQCPCSDASSTTQAGPETQEPSSPVQDHDDRTFDPRASRSNFSLCPLEYLMYCEDCHQIRCPRCVAEEIVTYYCPNCLFEVPMSNIKSEGNRCTRSCFQCPVCIGPLSVSSLETTPSANLLSADNASTQSGPYILTCNHCQWSSTEVGLKFEKPNGIYQQLTKLRNGGIARLTPKERKEKHKESQPSSLSIASIAESTSPPLGAQQVAQDDEELDIETQFGNLKQFYHAQLSEAASSGAGLSSLADLGFSSPGSLTRLMSLYTGSALHDKRSKARVGTMREALGSEEGLKPSELDERDAIMHLQSLDWDSTAKSAQQHNQLSNIGEAHLHGRSRFQDQLRPIPYLLRTKRSKRCPVCRHIISKPEPKVASTRFKIRLVAGNYIPSISIRPLHTGPGSNTAAAISSSLLTPLQPVQYLLIFKNPIFEPINVTLATPTVTPGRFASDVTILCPQFRVDANTDVWDEALKDGERDTRRRRGGEDGSGAGGQHQPEAGKIWERGRNWVSIVVEVMPASLRLDMLAVSKKEGEAVDLSPLKEDEDVLEIPMFVRVEWEGEPGNPDVGAAPGKDKDAKEKRELAYWTVLGLGRIKED